MAVGAIRAHWNHILFTVLLQTEIFLRQIVSGAVVQTGTFEDFGLKVLDFFRMVIHFLILKL